MKTFSKLLNRKVLVALIAGVALVVVASAVAVVRLGGREDGPREPDGGAAIGKGADEPGDGAGENVDGQFENGDDPSSSDEGTGPGAESSPEDADGDPEGEDRGGGDDGSPGDQGSRDDETPGTDDSSNDTEADSGRTPTPQPSPQGEGFAWAPWGPASPGDPPPYQWYGLLERRQCDDLLFVAEGEPLWEGLAAVCAAAIDGDQSKWSAAVEAAEAFRASGGPDDSQSCLEKAASALLERALAWHDRNPDGRPEVRFPAAGSETACGFRIDTAEVVGEGYQPTGEPLEGPVSGGTLIGLVGTGIDSPTRVVIGGRQADIVTELSEDPPAHRIVVRAPPVDEPRSVEIRLTNRAGEVEAPERFRFVASEADTTEQPMEATGDD